MTKQLRKQKAGRDSNSLPALKHASDQQSRDRISKKHNTEPSKPLQHYPLVFYTAIAYALAAVFAWVLACVLVYKPITTRHYGLQLQDGDAEGVKYPSADLYIQNQIWYQAARNIQAIVAVITIPLTSAVCSSAAVAYVQHSCKTKDLSLRQTVVLADKGWNELEIFVHLLKGRGKQYGSKFLYMAIALNLLGAITSPLQSFVLTTVSIHAPSQMTRVGNLSDLLSPSQHLLQDDLAAINLKAQLVTTNSKDPQSRLWSAQGAINCTDDGNPSSYAPCAFGQLSLANMSAIEDPFLAQLPAGYNTGLIRQFLPRVNSSVTRKSISSAEFPTQCQNQTFFASYVQSNPPSGYPWHLIACMPGSQTRPNLTYGRQRRDFSETLYLNLSAGPLERSTVDRQHLYQILINTTTGYFELPNYMNGQRPGPLLSGDPSHQCGRDCVMQGLIPGQTILDHENLGQLDPINLRRDATDLSLNGSYSAVFQSQKGPLLTIALALFGPESYIAERVSGNVSVDKCINRPPLKGLMSDLVAERSSTELFQKCITDPQQTSNQLQLDVMHFIEMFFHNTVNIVTLDVTYDQVVENAFTGAAYLANEQWLTSALEKPLIVSQDAGRSVQVPYASATSIGLISSLLGIYLIALLSLAVYSRMTAHWTDRLNALTMMQIGAAISKDLPFAMIDNDRHLDILDRTDGWVGDANHGIGDVGQLSLGHGTVLKAGRQYMSIPRKPEAESEPRPELQPGDEPGRQKAFPFDLPRARDQEDQEILVSSTSVENQDNSSRTADQVGTATSLDNEATPAQIERPQVRASTR